MIYKSKSFKRRVIWKKRTVKKSKSNLWNKFDKDLFYKFLKYSLIAFLSIIVIWWLYWFAWFNKNILKTLPDVSKIENILFAQTTVIQDKNWIVLYKLFDENRKYVPYEQISPNMVNALIAIEDKNFWTNPWFDPVWIIRAWIYDITHRTLKHWWSTITQQLIKNLLLTSDRKFDRKIKEIVLAVQLNWYIKNQINIKYKWFTSKEIDKKSKEKIMELYLNYVPFWNNTFGIETASQLYFGTSAQNLNIIQSAILASIPKSATIYNPYTKRENVIWWFSILNSEWEPVALSWGIYETALEKANERINLQTITFMNENDIVWLIKKTLSFDFTYEWKEYKTVYSIWRKDHVLARMFDSNMINQKELKEATILWINIVLQKNNTKIKAPHFVFYIIELLEKQYWSELIRTWWLTIKTSLDYNIQVMAEESTLAFKKELNSKWANNASMIYLDSKNWDILAYLWSLDYYDDTIDGKVDMIQSLRQPGSTIKPLIYTLGFMKNNFTIDTPIFDLPLTIGWNNPQNVDWRYQWLTTLKEALAWSRNLPAIKMFFINWGEDSILDFLAKIWINSTKAKKPKWWYWYSLSIGAWELKMIELANAYMHLSALWKPAKINPILEIRKSDNSILYKKNIEYQEQVIPSWVAYLLWEMLSNKNYFPADWRNTFTFPWYKVANKSWTTNTNDWKVKLPRDWWMSNYTPSKVAIFWAWNTKWEPMNSWAFWWWLSSPIWKDFFKKLDKAKLINAEEMTNNDVKTVSIATLSWKLPNNNTPTSLIRSTIWQLNKTPTELDSVLTKVQIDSLCNGLVTEWLTPDKDIIEGFLLNPYSIMTDNRDLSSITQRWINTWIPKYSAELWKPIFLEQPKEACKERQTIAEQWLITLNLISPSNADVGREFKIKFTAKSPFNIVQIRVFIGWVRRWVFDYSKKEINDERLFTVHERIADWTHKLKLTAIDEKGYEVSQETTINISSSTQSDIISDITPPFLINNLTDIDESQEWNIKISITFWDNESYVVWWKILQNWKEIDKFEWTRTTINVNSKEWLSYEVSDHFWNIWKWNITY